MMLNTKYANGTHGYEYQYANDVEYKISQGVYIAVMSPAEETSISVWTMTRLLSVSEATAVSAMTAEVPWSIHLAICHGRSRGPLSI